MLSVCRSSGFLVIALSVASVVGCASGAAPYQHVSLKGDLSAEALSRYREEMAAVPHPELRPLMTLESTNGWALGLVGYWRKGVVEAVMTPSREHVFAVSESRGYGPISMLYIKRESAVFDAEGRRLSAEVSTGVLWGQLMRKQIRQMPTKEGEWLMEGTVHLLFNLLHWRVAGGLPASFSLLGDPSPIGWGG
jgi:hypothetical protein